MADDINLLAQQKQPKRKKLSPFLTGALLFLSLVIFITVGIYLYIFYLSLNLDSIDLSEKNVVAENVKKYDSRRIRLLTVEERLLSIEKIISANARPSKRLQAVLDSIPPGVHISSISMETDKVTVSVNTENLSLINDLFDKYLKQIVSTSSSEVKKISIDGFSSSRSTGQYTALLKFTFQTAI